MNRLLVALLVGVFSLGTLAPEAEAKRLGSGASSGLKRQAPPAQAQTPAQPAQPGQTRPDATPGVPATGAAAAAATAAPKRNWMGPLAGVAAGLGLAALFSHLGMGAEFGSFITMLLMVVVGVVVLRFLWSRFGAGASQRMGGIAGGPQLAGAGAGAGAGGGSAPGFGSAAPTPLRSEPVFREAMPSVGSSGVSSNALAASSRPAVPASFDTASFERIAKLIFIRMQAANDAGNLDDLRQFATPEMFATFRLDLQDRKGATQQTDVEQLEAQVVDVEQEADRQVVSVRFHGLIREDKDAAAAPFDEVWHLVRPLDGSREWAIAGIAQNALA